MRTKKIPICDKEGTPQYLLGISEDITDIKRLNKEREQTDFKLKSAERINSLIQYALDAVVGMNDQGIITSWNSQSEKIFGWDSKNAIGRNLANLIIPPRYREAHTKGLKRYISEGVGAITNKRTELSALRLGGEEFSIELSVIPIHENNGYVFYAFVRDISERKNIELRQNALLKEEHQARKVAEETVEMQDDFISIAAHELKTPITPISMQLQLLERVIVKESATTLQNTKNQNLLRLSKNAKGEVDRLARLIDELLDISRISSGRLILNLEEFNLSHLVESTIERYRSSLEKSGSVIHTQIEPDVIGYWDLTRLESCVQNLLTNAIKYGDGNPIELNLKKIDKLVVLTVKDHGIGISEEDQCKVFKKFSRAVNVKEYSGFGLGLYIISEIAKAHGGAVKLESELHKGSTFSIELPIQNFN